MDAIVVVRSGVTKPLAMARPASINSLATTRSTSPTPGANARIGRASAAGKSFGNELDVIGGRPGALCHAGNRRRLHRKILAGGRGDDPVGEHTATLAAQRGDQEREGTYVPFAELADANSLSPQGRGLG